MWPFLIRLQDKQTQEFIASEKKIKASKDDAKLEAAIKKVATLAYSQLRSLPGVIRSHSVQEESWTNQFGPITDYTIGLRFRDEPSQELLTKLQTLVEKLMKREKVDKFAEFYFPGSEKGWVPIIFQRKR